jgi:hypothetical protein
LVQAFLKKGILARTVQLVCNAQVESRNRNLYHLYLLWHETGAGVPYRLGRLKSRASTSRGPLAKVYNIFVFGIDCSYTSCHNSFVIVIALHFRIISPISRH